MQEDILQSEGWEKFQQAIGRKTERISSVLAIEMPLPFGKTYLYSPRFSSVCHPEVTPTCPSEAPGERRRKDLTPSGTGAVFWRGEWDSELSIISAKGGYASGGNYQLSIPLVLRRVVEPEWTWRTLLEGSDDEILDRMHEKHRYNIRLAKRRGVVVRVGVFTALSRAEGSLDSARDKLRREISGDRSEISPLRSPLAHSGRNDASGYDFDACWSLLQETAKRQRISTHPRHHYDVMLATLPNTKVYFAEHSGTPIACAIIAYHGDTATYLHGGSSYEHRSFMAPHLLHWTAMRDACAAGMKWYEWGGIQPEAGSRKPEAATYRSAIGYRLSAIGFDWSGITRFKRGFGGETIHHPPMRDLVFQPKWYTMLSWFARLRR